MDPLGDRLRPFTADPAATALLFDFDGTLAPIVPDPDDARPAPGVVGLLDALAARYGRVGVVSGRPVDFLVAHLPERVALSGLYGLESQVDGSRVDRPGVEPWRAAVAEVVARATAAATGPDPAPGLAGMRVEPKGLSVTLHYRTRPEIAEAVRALGADLAAATGLELRAAKMSVELHPPVDTDKGRAVRELAAGATAVLFVGDDIGDRPAFAALAGLRAEGVHTLGVAVATSELPDEVRAMADLVIDGSSGVVALLQGLLGEHGDGERGLGATL